MISRAAAIFMLVCAAVSAACGAGQQTSSHPAPSGPIAAAARHIPKRATYALIFARVDGATGMIRNLMTPIGAAESEELPDRLDGLLRDLEGFSIINPADLVDHGVDVSRPCAVFSTGWLPTVLIPVADAGKVSAAVARLVGNESAMLRDHRGARITTVLGSPGVVYAQLGGAESGGGGWLAVHVSERVRKEEPSSLAWLDEILDAGGGADPSWAVAQLGARQDVVGWVDGKALLAALSQGECKPPEVLGRAAVGATLAEDSIDAVATVELTPEAAQALARHTAAPPDGSFLAARAGAAVALSIAVDLGWLGGVARAHRDACGLIGEVVRESGIDELDNVQPGVTSAHLAVLGAAMAGEDIDLDAMAWLGAGDETAIRTWLDFLFPPDARGHEQIAGLEVDTFKVDVLPLSEPIRFVLGHGALRMTSGRGVMEKLLGQASVKADGGGELAFFQLLPDAMPDTRPAGELLVVSGRMYEEDMRELSLFFASLKRLVLSASLDANVLRLAGGFELR